MITSSTRRRFATFALLSSLAFGSVACAPPIPARSAVNYPQPIAGNGGEVYCPYKADGSVAAWVDNGRNAKLGAAIGSAVGKAAGKQLLKSIPLFGGLLGDSLGKAAGRKIAIEMSGGWDYIKQESDLSFKSEQDMAIYLFAVHSERPDYEATRDLIGEIYTDFPEKYEYWIRHAPLK